MTTSVVITTSPAGVRDLATDQRGLTFHANSHEAAVRHAERVRALRPRHQVSTYSNFSSVRQARAYVTLLNDGMDAASACAAALRS